MDNKSSDAEHTERPQLIGDEMANFRLAVARMRRDHRGDLVDALGQIFDRLDTWMIPVTTQQCRQVVIDDRDRAILNWLYGYAGSAAASPMPPATIEWEMAAAALGRLLEQLK